MNPRIVEESEYGVYVWYVPGKGAVADDQGNFLSIASKKDDIRRIAELRNAARSYGIEEGSAMFLAGHRKIDDEEFERQKERMAEGLIPDEYDGYAYLDEIKGLRDEHKWEK